MAETGDNEKKKKKWWQINWNMKYHFVMSNDETMVPIFRFNLNLMNLVVLLIVFSVFLILLTTVIIAFTPLKEYIPGYSDTKVSREVYLLSKRADSIAEELNRKDVYFQNLMMVIEGYDFASDSADSKIDMYTPIANADTIRLKKSAQDSILRAEFESETQYDIYGNEARYGRNMAAMDFFVPLSGAITRAFEPADGHYGIDIAAASDMIIKAVQDGTVIYSTWSIDEGYTIGIQHDDNYFSTYKHNAQLLKKEGDFVRAGEAIAILGDSGDLSSGPHLHFELWHNGIALNPAEYMSIEAGGIRASHFSETTAK